MAVVSTATLKAFINANITANGTNSNTGANLNTALIDIVDSFFNVLSTPAVTGSGTANYVPRWASTNVLQDGTWTNSGNALVPVNNNSTLGSASLGVQMFGAAATTTTAPINLTSSAATNPSSPTEGMLWYNGTNLYFRGSSSTSDLLATSGVSGTTNTIAMFTGSTSVGDSPITKSTYGVEVLSQGIGIGVAADQYTDLYIIGRAANNKPVWFDSKFTATGSDVAALTARAITTGPNQKNMGGDFLASNGSGSNIGVNATSGNTGIAFDPLTDSFDRIGGVFQTATSSTKKVSATYLSVNGAGTAVSYGEYLQMSNSSSGDLIGSFMNLSPTGGTAYIGQWQDGNEGVDKVLKCVTSDGKAQWANADDRSKIVFSSYTIGTTSGPTTTATTSGTAPVIAEMTHTFTPADATNKIEVQFSGSFSNNKDENARCAIFIDGTIEAETEVRSYAGDTGGDFNGSLATFWQGTLSAASHTITIRMWTSGNTLTAVGTLRKMLIKEIDE